MEDREREGEVLLAAHGAELEAVSAERERRGAIAVLRCRLDVRHGARAGGDGLGLRTVALELAARDNVFDMRVHVFARREGDDRRRRLLRAEAVVVPRRRDSAAHQVRVAVDRLREHRDHRHEARLLLRRLARRVEVVTRVGVEAPVVVLPAAVHSREGLHRVDIVKRC